ncbi:hypothetical protein EDD85DRAFT_940920, partial [Armillaria nabsnona]
MLRTVGRPPFHAKAELEVVDFTWGRMPRLAWLINKYHRYNVVQWQPVASSINWKQERNIILFKLDAQDEDLWQSRSGRRSSLFFDTYYQFNCPFKYIISPADSGGTYKLCPFQNTLPKTPDCRDLLSSDLTPEQSLPIPEDARLKSRAAGAGVAAPALTVERRPSNLELKLKGRREGQGQCTPRWRRELPNADPDRFITSESDMPNTSSSYSQSLPLSSVCNAGSKYCHSINEPSHPECDAGSEHPTSPVRLTYSAATLKSNIRIQSVKPARAMPLRQSLPQPLRSLFAKLLPCLSCLRADFHNDDDVVTVPFETRSRRPTSREQFFQLASMPVQFTDHGAKDEPRRCWVAIGNEEDEEGFETGDESDNDGEAMPEDSGEVGEDIDGATESSKSKTDKEIFSP